MKYKYLFLLFLIGISLQKVHAQCSGCNVTVKLPGSASSTITVSSNNQTICFTGQGTFSGTLDFNNKNNTTVCIGDSIIFNPSTLQNPGSANPGTKFINYGLWTYSFSLQNNVDFVNYGTVNTASFNINGGNVVDNYGQFISSNTTPVNINNGASFISHAGSVTTFAGDLSVPSGGDFQVGGIVNVKGSMNVNSGATVPGIPPACAGLNVTGTFNNNGTIGGTTAANSGVVANKSPGTGSGNFHGSTNSTSPSIVSNPTDQVGCPGPSASFNVTASGPGVSYQWQRQTPTGYVNIYDGGYYSGTTTSTLVVSGAPISMSGTMYRVMVIACPLPIYSSWAKLTINPIPSATVSSTNVTICYGNNNGSITFSSPTGGSGSYQYSIDGGASWQVSPTFPNLIAKSYNVQIRDAAQNSCSKILNSALTLTQPAVLNATISQADVTVCNGNNNGTITVSGATGGSGSYQYSKDGGTTWSNSGSFTGLIAGNYDIRIRDAANTSCSLAPPGSPVNLGEPTVLSATATATDVTVCFGNNNGQITITGAGGGSGTYEYTINGGTSWSASNTFTTLPSANYNVQIRDKANPTCIKVINASLTIGQPVVLNATVNVTNVTQCFGSSNGAINIVSPSGGSGTYEYTINGGTSWNGTGSFTNLPAATNYNVKIRDKANPTCIITLNPALAITQPAQISASVTFTNVSGCNANTNGSISVNGATGGSGNFNYSKDGGTIWVGTGTSNIFSGLAAGTYNIQIRDAANPTCIIVLNNSVTLTEPVILNATAAGNNVTACFGNTNGSIDISTATGGSGSYQYSKDGGSTWAGSGTSFSFTGLGANNYNVQMRDASNPTCIKVLNATLPISQPTILSATLSSSNVTGCFGSTNGTITIGSPAGGSNAYEYTKDGSTWVSSGSFTGLAAGFYNVKIRDKNNPTCIITLNSNLAIAQPTQMSATATPTNVTVCNGTSNGAINITGASGGSGSYNFTIDNGTTWSTAVTTKNYTSLPAATYVVKMRDNATPACIITINASLTLTQPVVLSASVTSSNVTGCNGSTNGSISISGAAGGSGTYNYSIDNGSTWAGTTNSYTFPNIGAGTYNVIIRDAGNLTCTKTLVSPLNISQPVVLNANVTSTNVTVCNGASNGTITVNTATGGSGTYNFSKDGGSSWTATAATASFTNVPAGTYNIQMRDASNPSCVKILNNAYVVSQPPALSATASPSPVTGCFGGNNGSISVGSAAGGSGAYNFSKDGGSTWSGNVASIVYSGLTAGNYNIKVRDNANPTCIYTVNSALAVSQPAVLNATISSTPISGCASATSDGTITFNGSTGGSNSYGYSIDGGMTWQLSNFFNNLPAGPYNVVMRDANNPTCTRTLNATFVLSQTASLTATVDSTVVTGCAGNSNGSINITNANNTAGATANFEFSIDGGSTWTGSGFSHLFTGLSAATYNIQIRDALAPSCVTILRTALKIGEPDTIKANAIGVNDTICHGGNLGSIKITGATGGGSGTYDYFVLGQGWSASNTFTGLSAGTYTVQVRDKANNSCFVTLTNSLVLTEPATLNATLSVTDVTVCNGNNNGLIDISSPTGGNGTYEYSITGAGGFSSTSSYPNLTAGNYNVIIRDKKQPTCFVTLNGSLPVGQPVALSGTASSTDVTGCFGNSNGSITITSATGGSGNYQYSIDGGITYNTTTVFNNLKAAVYNVMIKDAANPTCTFAYNPPITINQPVKLNASAAGTNVSTCHGNNDGSIAITGAVGGSSNYQYSKDGGTTWTGSGNAFTFNSLTANSYTVMMRDASNITCIDTLNANLSITEPAILNASISPVNVTGCAGAANGRIDITGASGGSNNFNYSIDGGSSWSGSGNNYSFINLGAGTYSVAIRDASNPTCSISLNTTLVVTQPVQITANLTPTNATGCTNNGSIAVTNVAGGSGAYEYSKDGGSTWPGSGSGFTFSGLSAGSYDIRIRDAGNTACVVTINSSQTITQPSGLTATVNPTNVTGCNGNTNGSISITGATGGSGTFEYTVNGGTTWGGQSTFSNLAAGNYNVLIRDANTPSCFSSLNSNVVIGQPGLLNGTVGSSNVTTCFGNSNATITVSAAAGGSGSYEYQIKPGGVWQNTGSFTGLTSGSYVVEIRDAINPTCTKTLVGSLNLTEPGKLGATVASTNVTTCNGSNNGTITISGATGGSGGYEFSINGGSWTSATSYTSLVAGTYSVDMRDAANPTCFITLNSNLKITEPTALTAIVSSVGIGGCTGNSNGSVSITNGSGGSGSFEYSINGGTSWPGFGTSYNFNNLPANTYDLRMRDKNNPTCAIVLSNPLVITSVAPISATATGNNVSGCFGNSNGSIAITSTTGGSGAYQYSKDGGVSWEGSGATYTFPNLTIGTYTVQVRDANTPSCVFTLNNALKITQPVILNGNIGATMVSVCKGSSNGVIDINTPTGGSGTYEYSISGGLTWEPTGTYSNLVAGSYDVQIRDANNPTCVIVLSSPFNVLEPAILNAAITKTNVSVCNGSLNGDINITNATGGSGLFDFSIDGGTNWVGSGTSNDFSGIGAGLYDVQIRDANNPTCIIDLNDTLKINQPGSLTASLTPTSVSDCKGGNTGKIDVANASGGSGTYQYSKDGGVNWTATSSTFTFTDLTAGNYDVRIRDAANLSCVITLNSSLPITEPTILKATVTPTNVSACFGNSNGSIAITSPSGGSGNYEYAIQGSFTGTTTYSNLAAGTYPVQIRDKAFPSCVIVLDPGLILTQPGVLKATVTPADATVCFGSANGSITFTSPSGGSGGYEYSLDNITYTSTNTFGSLPAGTYKGYVRDAANPTCFILLGSNFVIQQPSKLDADSLVTNVTNCFGNSNGAIEIKNATGGSGNYEYTIDGVNYLSTSLFSNLTANTYNVKMRDASNPTCILTINGALKVIQPAILNASVSPTDVSDCKGGNTGKIIISGATGGSNTYQYSNDGGINWTGAGNAHTFLNLTAGNYDVRIRDLSSPSCEIVLNSALPIGQPGVLTATVNPKDVSVCFGSSNGGIDIVGSTGGSGNYEYSIANNFTSTTNYQNLPAGTYKVEMRDAVHPSCVVVLNSGLILNQPIILSGTVNTTDVTTCFGKNNGSIDITNANGGSGSFQFSMDNSTWNSSGNFPGLVAGTNYKAYIRDAGNVSCVIQLGTNIAIKQPNKLQADSSVTDVSNCFGNSNGSIAITNVSGGSGSFEYTNDGGTNWTNSAIFTGLSAGAYNVQMRDANNQTCVLVINTTLPVTQPDLLSATVSANNVSGCNGNKNGSIVISGSNGGSGAFEYTIDGGANWKGFGTFTNLGAGNNNVIMRDAAHPSCEITLNSNLKLTEPIVLSGIAQGTNVSGCNGSTNGEINISNSSGGSGAFEYTIDNGNNWRTSPNYASLSAGTYNVKMRDAANLNCVMNLNSSLSIVEPTILTANLSKSDVSGCFGNKNASITIANANGGSGSFEYTIDGGNTWSNTSTFSNLPSGSYNVKLRDAANPTCSMDLDGAYVVQQPGMLSGIVTDKDVSGCVGNTNGSITITNASGGSGNYNYSDDGGTTWVGSGTNYTFNNLPVGTYNVQIRDAATPSCLIVLNNSATLANQDSFTPPVITNQPTAQGPVCAGSAQPVFNVTATGTALTYQWRENGVNIQDNLIYSGSQTSALTIKNAPASYNGKAYDVVINGTCGTVTSSAPAPLLTVISQSAGGSLSGSKDICEGGQSGPLNLSSENGNIIQWQYSTDTTSGTWTSISNTTTTYDPGILQKTTFYRVTVQNGNCAADYSSVAVKNIQGKPTPSSAGSDQIICGPVTSLNGNQPSTGKGYWKIVNGSGGSVQDTTSISSSFSGVEGSTYLVEWKISNGVCTAERDTVSITLKPAVHASVNPDQTIQLGRSAPLLASGGSTYLWSPSATLSSDTIENPSATPAKTTTYEVIVGNNAGCYDTATVTVIIEGVIIPNAFSPNGDGVHDTWQIQNVENYPNANLSIFNRWGQNVGKIAGGAEVRTGWDGKNNGAELPMGTYFYILKLDDTTPALNGSITILK